MAKVEADEQDEHGDEVEEGYKMAKVSGYLHFSNEHRPEVTTRVNEALDEVRCELADMEEED